MTQDVTCQLQYHVECVGTDPMENTTASTAAMGVRAFSREVSGKMSCTRAYVSLGSRTCYFVTVIQF